VALALVPPLLVFVPVAKAAFDVVARTRNPAVINVATIVKNFVVLIILYVYW
jgi:hypothetical protein